MNQLLDAIKLDAAYGSDVETLKNEKVFKKINGQRQSK